MKEIERKWFLSKLPKVDKSKAIPFERHFLFINEVVEIRIQKRGKVFQMERKEQKSQLERSTEIWYISEAEFKHLKKFSIGSIERESYEYEGISIKVYKGRHEGLIRAEVEFLSEQEARQYVPPKWFGAEITDSPLGRDKKLSQLPDSEFQRLLKSIN